MDRVAATMLLGAAVVNLGGGSLFAWTILLPSLTAEFAASSAAVSSVFSLALVIFTAVVVLAGGLADAGSPRVLAIVAGVVAGLGLGLSAAAPSLPFVAVGYGGLFGAGSGLGYVTAVRVAGTQFGARRGLALGVVVGAYAAGPVVLGPLGTVAIETFGWRPSVAVLALAVASATLAAAIWLPTAPSTGSTAQHRRLPRPSRAASTGEGAGGWARSSCAASAAGEARRPLWLLWALFLCAAAPGLLAFAYATEIALERDMTVRTAGVLVGLLAAGSLGGRLVAGPISDRFGVLTTTRLTLIALALAGIALGWLPAAAVVLVAMPVLGVAYGAISTLLPAATAEVARPERFGAAYGRVFSAWGSPGYWDRPPGGGSTRSPATIGWRSNCRHCPPAWRSAPWPRSRLSCVVAGTASPDSGSRAPRLLIDAGGRAAVAEFRLPVYGGGDLALDITGPEPCDR